MTTFILFCYFILLNMVFSKILPLSHCCRYVGNSSNFPFWAYRLEHRTPSLLRGGRHLALLAAEETEPTLEDG